MNRHQYLDPVTLARIRDLKLLARTAIEGSRHGFHTSRQRGAGLEFNQYRQYEHGDDPRQIDWRLYARSDRVFVRQSERESQLDVWFLLDTTASMQQPSGQVADWTRLDYARSLVACLAWAAQTQGDACGLLGINARGLDFLPARAGPRHLDALLMTLEGLSARGTWPADTALPALWEHLRKPGLVIVVSDFFQAGDELEKLVSRLRAARQEVMTLQLVTSDELDFPYTGTVEFIDRETGERVRADARAYRESYRQRITASLTALARAMARLGVVHERLVIEAPLDDAVWRILNYRSTLSARQNRAAAR
ncbi:MAG: DUF58 domain-containing protein [Pseudomonadota bacterium]